MAEAGYAKGRARRDEIIREATDLFGNVGYRGASLREVAARCGITHSGLIHHFPTKAALLQGVLERRDEEDTALVHSAATSGVDGLRRIVALAARNTTRRRIIELFSVLAAEATSVDHPAHDYFVRRYANSVEVTAELYRQALAEGALGTGVDPPVAARQLVALMDGLQLQWLLADGAVDMEAAVRSHIQGQLVVPL